VPFIGNLVRVAAWSVLPNGRRASFFDVWAGHALRPDRFRRELREDLGTLFGLLADGTVTAQIAAEYPLADAVAALRYAESGGLVGKVVLRP